MLSQKLNNFLTYPSIDRENHKLKISKADLLMRQRLFDRKCAACSQDTIGMLKVFMRL